MKVDITALRESGGKDGAIVDLLQLVQLEMVPGRIRTRALIELWGCHQCTVSRRMAAIAELGCCTVRSSWGGYTISPEKTKAKRLPRYRHDPQAARQRWENLRQRWQEVAA
jgi:hypothetical protein